jgi:hypothetical protein
VGLHTPFLMLAGEMREGGVSVRVHIAHVESPQELVLPAAAPSVPLT